MCGEKRQGNMNKEVKVGSPPRMRGKVIGGFGVLVQIGITPACAGKSALCVNGGARSRDHPRMCGEKTAREFITYLIQGSPPRMRGRVPARRAGCRTKGITPAYAGKRRTTRTSGARYRDHPRVCGEEPTGCYNCGSLPGSPPRMRGRAEAKEADRLAARITPAYAGKRVFPGTHIPPVWDHPRVCGEEGPISSQRGPWLGSPPRMRGRETDHSADDRRCGITPAYAGKSMYHSFLTGGHWDHPRVCGEEVITASPEGGRRGSPPRMRGRAQADA